MAIYKYKIRTLLVTVLGTATLFVAPVYAQHDIKDVSKTGTTTSSETTGSSGGSSASSGGSSSSDNSGTEAEPNDTSVNHDTVADDTGANSGSGSLHDRAEKLLATKRENHKEQTATVRQKVCANHKTEIDDKLTNLGTRAQNHLDTFNAIFTKVQAFQTSKQLTVPTYDSLVATATAKQAAATSAVANLKALSGTTIDCTATDPAAALATVKTAADDAKSALQAYRTSIKDVIKALQAAKAPTNTSGSN